MGEIQIGLARPEDANILAKMYAEDMRNLGIERTAEEMLALVKGTLAGQDHGVLTFVARCGREVAGVLLTNTFWSLKVAGQALWIEELFVRPAFRRRGLGMKLVEYLLDWAENNGFGGVELEAYRMNTAASLLYRELDFRRLARERYCYYFAEHES